MGPESDLCQSTSSETLLSKLTRPKRKRLHSESYETVDELIGAHPPLKSPQTSKKRRVLRIEIPAFLSTSFKQEDPNSSAPSCSSLFSALDTDSPFGDTNSPTPLDTPALRNAPPIPGLFFDPSVLLPQQIAEDVMSFCMVQYFQSPGVNQVMLFSRFSPPSDVGGSVGTASGLPTTLLSLLQTLSSLLRPLVPDSVYDLLFPKEPTRARQAIINLYQPGEGITPHVDLLGRYGDGIIGVSFNSGCIMRFDKVTQTTTTSNVTDEISRWDLFLPDRSVIVLSEDARYQWTHGIERKTRDFVSPVEGAVVEIPPEPTQIEAPAASWIERGVRLSVTFRWLLPGAEVVGPS